MISFRQADLFESLNRSKPLKFTVNFRYEEYKLEMTSATPEGNFYDDSVMEKRDHLEAVIISATSLMGFYENPKNKIWTYNTSGGEGNMRKLVMEVRRRLESYGDPRIVSVRDSIGENISLDRFTIEATVK